MSRLIKMRNPIIQPIDRQQILNQILRPDAEKIRLFRELLRTKRRARNFDHAPDLHFTIEWNLFAIKLLPNLLQQRICLPQLFNPADHRIHHFDFTKMTRPQNRPKLILETLRKLETEPNRPKSEKRIRLVVMIRRMLIDLVRTEIDRPDHNRMRR